MNEVLAREAQAYFRKHSVLTRLAASYGQKYRSLGHFGGIATLENLTAADRQVLSGFLRRDCRDIRRVSFRAFVLAWEKSRFQELPVEEFLLSLQPANFMTKQAERAKEQQARQAVLSKLQAAYPADAPSRWLTALQERELRLAQKEFYLADDLLAMVAKALTNLPSDFERLPIFANRITGNPHAFDHSEAAGRLLLQALAYLKGESVPADADERTRLFYDFHIIRDDILNFATVYGLRAYRQDGGEITYWRESARTFSPLNIPLREIAWADRIVPVRGHDVYIVENSGVFSALVDALQMERKTVPLLALHGQLKAASWALLDKLSKSGCRFHYAGDLDPEGLAIAQRLLTRYTGAQLWHMSVTEYRQAELTLPAARLKKIPDCPVGPLQELTELMRQEKKVLYQESLLEALVSDLGRVD